MDDVPDAVVQAARLVFSECGYGGATLERIAREAGLSRVTLHRRGWSKQRLFGVLVARAVQDYQRALWPALTGGGAGHQRLEEALHAVCQAAEENLGLLLSLSGMRDAVFHDEADQAMTRGVFTAPLERILRDGIADGTLQATEPVEAATVLFNVVGWSYVHLRSGHRWPPERAAHATIDLAMHGLRARPVASSTACST
jgi:AcrR family transcriptional regulator